MAKTNKDGLTSSFSLFTMSKELVLKNLRIYIMLNLLPFVAAIAGNIGSSQSPSKFENFTGSSGLNISPAILGFGALIALAFLFLYVIVTIMQYALNLEVAKGNKPDFHTLWQYVQKYGVRVFGVVFLTGLAVMLGLLALVVPGIIFYRRYFLAPYVLIDKDLSIIEAMKESSRISKPYAGSIWGVIGVSFLLGLPGVIPVFGWVISFVLALFYAAAPAMRYLEIKKLVSGSSAPAQISHEAHASPVA